MTQPLVLLLAVAGTACAGSRILPPEPDPLPAESPELPPLALGVEGIVMDRWGYVVPNASVTVRVGSPGEPDAECAGASHLPTRTRTSPTGRFAVVVEAGRRPPFRACLEVEALPPPSLPWRDNTVVVPSAAFAPGGAGGATEVVQVRVVLY